MAKTFLVARREFLENARTKGFWISIFLGPLLILGSIALMVFFQTKKDVRKFAVLDQSGWLAAAIEADFLEPDIGRIFGRFAAPSEGEIKKDAEAEEAPAFLQTKTWKRYAMAYGTADAEQRAQLEAAVSIPLRREFAAIGREFPADKIPGFAKAILDQAGAGTEDLKEAWRDLWLFRDWWQGLSKEESRGLTQKGWDARFELVETVVDKGKPTQAQAKDGQAEENSQSEAETKLSKRMKDGELFAYFVLEDVPLEKSRIGRYVSDNLTDNTLRRWYSDRATEVLRRKRIDKIGLGHKEAQQILLRASFKDNKVDAAGVRTKVEISDRAEKGAPIVFVIILWMSVLMISQMLLSNTIEEKSNRIIEVLLSSVSPLQLMAGKIFGLAWTGVAILGFYALFAIVAINVAPMFLPDIAEVIIKMNIQAILSNPVYLGSFFVYFITGYLFFASLLVAIGSVSNSLKDAQNLALPVMILLFVPYIASFVLVSDPNGTLARILSYIPPFTPFIMMGRAGGPPPMIDYVLTTALLIVSTVFCFYAAAKVFRVGILMTGKPPKIREILHWLRAPVGQVPQVKD